MSYSHSSKQKFPQAQNKPRYHVQNLTENPKCLKTNQGIISKKKLPKFPKVPRNRQPKITYQSPYAYEKSQHIISKPVSVTEYLFRRQVDYSPFRKCSHHNIQLSNKQYQYCHASGTRAVPVLSCK